jgi:hypothetical protein
MHNCGKEDCECPSLALRVHFELLPKIAKSQKTSYIDEHLVCSGHNTSKVGMCMAQAMA